MKRRDEYSIEAWGEATARVIGKLISACLRIVWAVIAGILSGLCLLPFLRGVKKAIIWELEHPVKPEDAETEKE